MTETIYGTLELDIIGPGYTTDVGDPATGKPYLRLTLPDGLQIAITANLAMMIGGAGSGALARYTDLRPGPPRPGKG